MKDEFGCVCAELVPPGSYSTSTTRMLLPGTLGSGWSKTILTFSPTVSWACAPVAKRPARAAVQRRDLIIVLAPVLRFVTDGGRSPAGGGGRRSGSRSGGAARAYDLMNASRSGFTNSACVVHIPCGKFS